MTNRQLAAKVDAALKQLKGTRAGYLEQPNGPRWRVAIPTLELVARELRAPAVKVPPLGPLVKDGLATLLMAPTHLTTGVDWTPKGDGIGFYTAFDAGFGAGGRPVLAVEALKVTRRSSAEGGEAFYATGASGIWYWYGHLDRTHAPGVTFRKGELVGLIKHGAGQPPGGPHAHLGLDVTPLGIPRLLYGGQRKPTDRPQNYTFGSPTIGAQLAKSLAKVAA